MCVRCVKASRVAKLVTIDGNIGLLCGVCHSEFEQIKDFYKIAEFEQMEAFRQFCRSGIVVKYRDEESLAYMEVQNEISKGVETVRGWE